MNNNKKKVVTIFDSAKICKALSCDECPLSFTHNGYGINCSNFLLKHTEEANDVILAWLEEEEKKKIK